ncbi:hypothetical protein [Acanthopleuribacter pedis]|uniref:Transmembrane protein n=1 Tax=Acanthopleuribacter pedis TaxID=442870 RepID=A0A8J7QFV6_9BACT|nr:hypothetical protein [Acanthopleuribacter pedis]MBO1319220.1 hypothetical protein [Acanthopleuribacter pedis]
MWYVMTILVGLSLVVITMNLETWPMRVVWVVLAFAPWYFVPDGYGWISFFATIVLLSSYQTVVNWRDERRERAEKRLKEQGEQG